MILWLHKVMGGCARSLPVLFFGGFHMSDLVPIKLIIKESGVKQWQIAEVMGIHENTLIRMLRHEPDDELRQKILRIIDQLK